ncbi:MAG: ATP-binding protein [Bacteroidales bacterium]
MQAVIVVVVWDPVQHICQPLLRIYIQLIVIDDVMTLPLGREDGNRFFVFLNQIYETTSYIITTNKSPAEWARSVDDETLATALLDRLLYKCQLIQLQGKSYRMQNRQTIF